MKLDDLRIDVETEFSLISETIHEISEINLRSVNKTLSKSDITAGAAYLAQCYNGYENILKRIIKYIGFPLPNGPFWHVELLNLFTDSPDHNVQLPILIPHDFFPELTALRKIRHTVVHGYAIRLEWEFISHQLENINSLNAQLKDKISEFIQ